MENIISFEKISKWSESKRGLYYIILISVLLKLLLFASDSVINNDGLIYISAAQKLAAGHFKESLKVFSMPLYPLLIAMFYFLIPNWVSAAKMLSMTFMVFTLIPLYLLTKELFNRKAAFWACLAFAFAPVQNSWANSVIRDPGFIFCVAWAVYFAVRSIETTRINYFIQAVLFSYISILFRIEGIILVLFFQIYFLVLSFIKGQERFSLLRGALLFLVIPIILIIVFFVFGFNELVSFNRSGEIYTQFRSVFNLEFLTNYYALSEQLKFLVQFSPFPDYKNNFAEIARHYIPVIYFFGLTETFIVVLYPLYVFPLFFSFKESVKINHVFILGLLLVFILLAYFFLIKMDLLTSRYLSIPVLLIYPWVGCGIKNLFVYLLKTYSKKVFVTIFCLFFILPLYKSVEQKWNEDNSLIVAAKWIANNPDTRKLRIITEDKRFLLYAGREHMVEDAFSGTGKDAFYNLDTQGGNYNELEQIAMQKKFDLVLLRISAEKEAPQFNHFKKLKEFKGTKNISYVFLSPEASIK